MQSIDAPLSIEDAHRAIYVDFEGYKNESPVLLGRVWAQGRRPRDENLACCHDVHAAEFGPLVGMTTIEAPALTRYEQRPLTLRQAIHDLVSVARAQDRLIVAWSRHEFEAVALENLPAKDRTEFVARYRNAIPTVKRWAKANNISTARGTNQLIRYLDLIGYPTGDYGKNEVTKRLNAVRGALAAGRSYAEFTERQQLSWTGVLEHNYVDCAGMRHLVKLAAGLS